MGKKRFITTQIEKMRTLAFTEIPQKLAANPAMPLDAYLDECRLALNMVAVSALTGGEFVESKKKDGDKKWKVKFDHSLPNKTELLQICDIMNSFIGTVENPFLKRFVIPPEAGENDMEIPDQGQQPVAFGTNVPKIEKINKKKLESYIFGKDGKPSMCKMLLTSIDCIQIAALGEDLRKKENIDKMLIIGGIALALTGAAVAGVCIYRHTKKDDVDDIITDINCEDTTIITDITDDDAPVVSVIA